MGLDALQFGDEVPRRGRYWIKRMALLKAFHKLMHTYFRERNAFFK